MSPRELNAVLAIARSLQRAALASATQPLLRGKKLGLLGGQDDSDADLFRRAATELGAYVARVRPLSNSIGLDDVLQTARVLGRLYDALECQDMAPALVQRMRLGAGVPVFDGIASPRHPTTATLVAQLDDHAAEADKRRFVVQAVLVESLVS